MPPRDPFAYVPPRDHHALKQETAVYRLKKLAQLCAGMDWLTPEQVGDEAELTGRSVRGYLKKVNNVHPDWEVDNRPNVQYRFRWGTVMRSTWKEAA